MNAPLPPGLFTNNSYFYANNSFTLGSMSKPVNARTLVSVDYSSLPNQPVTPASFWFEVDVGSQPPLTVSSPQVNGSILTFLLSNGVPGVSYNLSVSISYGEQVRTDYISIEVPAEDGCGCGGGSIPFPIPGAPILIPPNGNIAGFLTGEGTVFINSGVRYFVSAVAPPSAVILDQWYNSLTGVVSELITDGSNLIWMPFNQVPKVATESLFSEQLTVTAVNTVSPFTKAYDGSVIEIIVNGVSFFPLGPNPDFHMSGQNVVWTSSIYSINMGDTVVAVYSYALPSAGGFFMEKLTITALNSFPLLTNTPNGNYIEVVVNGRTFNNVGSSPPFMVMGKQIIWLSTTYSVVPGATVVVNYSF
jgi:hypothetical protein